MAKLVAKLKGISVVKAVTKQNYLSVANSVSKEK